MISISLSFEFCPKNDFCSNRRRQPSGSSLSSTGVPSLVTSPGEFVGFRLFYLISVYIGLFRGIFGCFLCVQIGIQKSVMIPKHSPRIDLISFEWLLKPELPSSICFLFSIFYFQFLISDSPQQHRTLRSPRQRCNATRVPDQAISPSSSHKAKVIHIESSSQSSRSINPVTRQR